MRAAKAEVTIKGASPLLMHAFPMVPIEALEKKTPAEQAEFSAYRMPSSNGTPGDLYIPGINIQRALIAGAAFSKGKGRASLQKPVAACVEVTPERIALGQDTFEIDSRPVVVPATKGRVLRHRPRLDDWEVSFAIGWDADLITEKQIRTVLDDTGRMVGLLDFRPEKKGPFGKFMVTKWQV